MKKILVVEDEEGIQLLYQEEFQEEGYEVISAFTGEEALEKFRSAVPDLVILDIQLPGMNGIEVLRQMKMVAPQLPIILSTAFDQYKQDLSCWASDEFIVKSPDLQKLKEAVHKYLG